MQTYLEKEKAERTRQYGLMRKFFDGKRAMLDARQAVFLHRYPYIGVGVAADLRKFERAVRDADETQRVAIADAFMMEKNYWNSAYVLDHCNCNIHMHIVETLDSMEKILSVAGYTYGKMANKAGMIPCVKDDTERNEVDENDEQGKLIMPCNSWGRAGEDAVDYVLRNCREIICIFLESMLIYVMNEFSDSGGHFHGT